MVTIPRPYLTVASSLLPRWQQHKVDWHDCTDCPLHHSRQQTVYARGQLPCRVLFIGEAPGKSEDLLGYPFIGEAGYLLQDIIEDAQACYSQLSLDIPIGVNPHTGEVLTPSTPSPPFRYAITNTVLCRPPEDTSVDIRPPKREEAQACSRRLNEFIALAEPQMIVLVGVPARKFVARQEGIHYCEIMHPAAMLRITGSDRNGSNPKQEIAVRRAINTIVDNLTILDGMILDGYKAGPQPEGMTTTTGGDIGKRAIPPKVTGGEIVRLARTLANAQTSPRPTRSLSKVRRAHPRK